MAILAQSPDPHSDQTRHLQGDWSHFGRGHSGVEPPLPLWQFAPL